MKTCCRKGDTCRCGGRRQVSRGEVSVWARPWFPTHLELGGHLADERDELLQVLGLAVLQHVLGGGGDEGQHLLLQADDHAVQEGAHRAAQHPPLDGAAQRRQEGLHAVAVDLSAAALLHRLFVAERLAGPTVNRGGGVSELAADSGAKPWVRTADLAKPTAWLKQSASAA